MSFSRPFHREKAKRPPGSSVMPISSRDLASFPTLNKTLVVRVATSKRKKFLAGSLTSMFFSSHQHCSSPPSLTFVKRLLFRSHRKKEEFSSRLFGTL